MASMRSQFVASISHELKTPLTSIRMFADTLRMRPDDPATRGQYLERVTWNVSFDGFPMFSPDGRRLVFASNRFQKISGETNVFIADWRW